MSDSVVTPRPAPQAHTPGPWCVETPMEPMELTIVQAGLETYEWRFIASLSLPEEGDSADYFSRAVVEANARLIAAAPELLSALAAVLASGLNGGNNVRMAYMGASRAALTDKQIADAERSESAVQAALTAIARATGQ